LVGEDLDIRDRLVSRIATDNTPKPALVCPRDPSHHGIHTMAGTADNGPASDVDVDELAGMTPGIPVRRLGRLESRQTM